MGFGFGGISNTTKAKALAVDKSEIIQDCILYNHFNPTETYYLFLLEGPPRNKKHLEKIISKIDKEGYASYIIASATTSPYDRDKVKQVYDHLVAFQSDWKKLIDYNGVHVKAIMPFGAAIHAINCGTHITTDCFYDMWMNKSYYYIGHGFIGNYDCFIYPVDSVEVIYEYAKDSESQVNWKTRFFFAQTKNMLKTDKQLPDDMRDYKIVRCTDGIDKTKENARMIRHTAKDILNSLMNSKCLAWDTETDSLSWAKGTEVKCITLSNDGETGYYIPFNNVILKDPELRMLLLKVFYSCDTMVGANIKFDLHWIKKFIPRLDFDRIKRIDDVGQLSHCINSNRTKGLKPLSFFYTPFGGYDNELDTFKAQTKIKKYTLIPDNILYKYAALDAIVTWRVFQSLLNHVRWIDKNFPNEKPIKDCTPNEGNWGMERWYNDMMVPCYPLFAKVEHNGICIDHEYQCKVRERLQKNIKELKEKLSKIWNVPESFDFGSTQKLGILFEKLGWPAIKMDKQEKYYATSDECIQEWKRQGRAGIPELISLRENTSFLNSFIGIPESRKGADDATGWEQFIVYHPETNEYIINHSYNIMGTETFRHIAKNPNFQNIPSHSKLAVEIKRCITVPTTEHFTIESSDGNVYEGGCLDTVEVEGKGRISLSEVSEFDNIIPNSFVEYKSEFDGYFD